MLRPTPHKAVQSNHLRNNITFLCTIIIKNLVPASLTVNKPRLVSERSIKIQAKQNESEHAIIMALRSLKLRVN